MAPDKSLTLFPRNGKVLLFLLDAAYAALLVTQRNGLEENEVETSLKEPRTDGPST